jgi:hypothetical protein
LAHATGFAPGRDAIGITSINPYLIEQAERVVHFPAKRNGRSKKEQPDAGLSCHLDPRKHSGFKHRR